jgi:small subunit ribosomal protein S18
VLRKTENKGWTSKRARAAAEKPSTKEELRNRDVSEKLSRLMPRFWKDGDVYAPADLNANEARKWRGKGNVPDKDVCDLLGINPLDMYRVSLDTLGGRG